MEPDPLRELERQIERGQLYSHATLSQQAERTNENEAIIRGLVELLIERDVIEGDDLVAAVSAVREQTKNDPNIAVRVDSGSTEVGTPVDCAARLHACKAVCCRLRFPLTIEEVEHGPVKWDLGRPYLNRQSDDGYCHQCAPGTRACKVYDQRPAPCRQYSCADDPRIWKDFDAMEINQEFVDRLGGADIVMEADT